MIHWPLMLLDAIEVGVVEVCGSAHIDAPSHNNNRHASETAALACMEVGDWKEWLNGWKEGRMEERRR